MKEIFRDVVGYEGKYKVSNLGNVLSLNFCGTNKPRLLKAKQHHTGYMLVRLTNGKNKLVHTLVAQAFIPNPENKRCVNHKDGNKRNNNVANLEWCTHKENVQHAIQTGLRDPHNNNARSGRENAQSKQIAQCTKQGTVIKVWDCISDAARELGCNPCMITNVAQGRHKTTHGYAWKYISDLL